MTTAPDPEPFDLLEFRRAQAAKVLARAVPAKFRDAFVDDAQVRDWANRFLAEPTTAGSLVLSGPTGSGKTWLAYATLCKIVRARAEQGLGLKFRVTSHPDLNDRLRPKSDDSHQFALEPFLSADLVILDDLGAGKQTDWTGDSLYRLVDHRWSNLLPTIFTTNMVPARLTEAVGDRVVSRIGDATKVAVKGADRRWAA